MSTDESKHGVLQACTVSEQVVSRHDLPLSCPMEGMPVWNAHPKVYLPIEVSGREKCPYCGTVFVLHDD